MLVRCAAFQEDLDFLSRHFHFSANQSDLPMDADTLAQAHADKHCALTTLTDLPGVHGLECNVAANHTTKLLSSFNHTTKLLSSFAVGAMTIRETNCGYITLAQR